MSAYEWIGWPSLGQRYYQTKHIDHDTWVDAYYAGYREPNYPMPAIRQRDWVHIGYLSALNNFKVDDAFVFIQRYF